jgi:predicted membrane protein
MHEIAKLDRKGLREFGLLTGTIIAILFGLVLPLIRGHDLFVIPWIIGGVLGVLALFLPQSLAPIYQVWMRIGLVLGWINSRIILGIIFFVVVTPMSVMMRVLRCDPMTRKFEAQLATYRVPSQIKNRKSMEKPY